MRVKDDRANRLVKLYLSWFTLSKRISLAKPVSRQTFESIVSQPIDNDKIMRVVTERNSLSRLGSTSVTYRPPFPLCRE